MTEQSRAECEYRQRAPFALLIPFSSSTLFHPQENWDAPMQGNRASALTNWAAWGRDCGHVRISGPLAGDVRGAHVRCAM